MKKVLIAGYFDPLHEGHLDHIVKASELGDYLVIVTHTDECTERVKGRRFTIASFRRFILESIIDKLGIRGEVIVTNKADVADVIEQVSPDIFAKGRDRMPSNMPGSELQACDNVGCKIIYGIGAVLNSSSRIKKVLLSEV